MDMCAYTAAWLIHCGRCMKNIFKINKAVAWTLTTIFCFKRFQTAPKKKKKPKVIRL